MRTSVETLHAYPRFHKGSVCDTFLAISPFRLFTLEWENTVQLRSFILNKFVVVIFVVDNKVCRALLIGAAKLPWARTAAARTHFPPQVAVKTILCPERTLCIGCPFLFRTDAWFCGG
jgi:hypothetical protein